MQVLLQSNLQTELNSKLSNKLKLKLNELNYKLSLNHEARERVIKVKTNRIEKIRKLQ